MIRSTIRFAAVVAVFGLAGCANGSGFRGNDTGGIIPASPATYRDARFLAEEACREEGKAGRVTSRTRRYGYYITYNCVFDGPRRRNARPSLVVE